MPRSDLISTNHNVPQNREDFEQSSWFDEDDPWEYEYDDAETEDFFFTLDLTAHLPDALVKHEAAANGITFRQPRDLRHKQFQRVENAPTDLTTPETQQQSVQHNEDSPHTNLANDEHTAQHQNVDKLPESIEHAIPPSVERSSSNTLQIVGLHTTKPYLMFNNKFYTTYWLTDIGSQIWVTRPGVTETTAWSGNVLDVVGLSRARLLARPAKLEPKYDSEAVADAHSNRAYAATHSLHANEPILPSAIDIDGPVQQLVIPTQGTTEPALIAQAAFMEKLSSIKIRKGEQDQMPLYSVRTYELPANAAEIRAQAWDAEDDERARLDKNGDTAAIPRLIREPNQPGRRYAKPGARHGFGERPAESPIAVGATSIAAEDQDDIQSDTQASEAAQEDDELSMEHGRPFDKASALLKRGPKKRSAKLAALGLTGHGAESASRSEPRAKRKRRTKAEMEAARKAEATARAEKTQSFT